jgi:pimeloyl-ACP methyl ester carboxylesterase
MRLVKFLVAIVLIVIVTLAGFVYLAPEKTLRAAINAERNNAGLVRKQIDLPDGLHYVYLEGGQGEPLLLLHGFGANKDNFNRVAKFLTPHYRVIVPDHIGFGESAHPQQADYAPPAQVEHLHALMQALGVTTVHLGGSSMGGQIAMTYAALHPAEVKSLWLLAPAGVWSAPESELRKVLRETGRNLLMARNEQEFAGVFAFVMTDPPFVPRPLLNAMAQERIANFALEERIIKQIAADPLEQRVAGLATPALIVWGDRDRALNPASAEILHKLLPHSQVVMMSGIGHLPMIEQPQTSADAYLHFRGSL